MSSPSYPLGRTSTVLELFVTLAESIAGEFSLPAPWGAQAAGRVVEEFAAEGLPVEAVERALASRDVKAPDYQRLLETWLPRARERLRGMAEREAKGVGGRADPARPFAAEATGACSMPGYVAALQSERAGLEDLDFWVFLQRVINGKSFAELAARLGRPETEVEWRFENACRGVARALDEGNRS